MTSQFAIPAPDTTPPDQFRPDDFRGFPEAAQAHERGDWRHVGDDEPVTLTGQAA
jgi:hypothetical protein